jgi:hypothetical protein
MLSVLSCIKLSVLTELFLYNGLLINHTARVFSKSIPFYPGGKTAKISYTLLQILAV